MGPLDGLWHLLNFLGPAVGVGAVTAVAGKLLWRKDLAGVRWPHLLAWAVGTCVLVLVVGLALTGQDGRMVTYAAMVVGCALVVWAASLWPTRGR